MAKGIMVVQSRPSDPAREEEYNRWYSEKHVPDVCAIPGFVGARRYKVHGGADSSQHEYAAIYEIEADDLSAPVQELSARAQSGELEMSDVLQLDPPPAITIYELIE